MIWSAESVDSQPEIQLVCWAVVAIRNGDRHLVGQLAATCEGRVSSAIQAFDPILCRFVTASGRAYRVLDVGTVSTEARFVWREWCQINKVESWREVTEAYEPQVEASLARLKGSDGPNALARS